MLHAMIMAGGGGTRFWPKSRKKKPKQFLQLGSERSLIQQAYDRLEGCVTPDNMWVITAEAYREETRAHLPEISQDRVIGEPVGRDTAPCVALGAALIHAKDPDAIMLVTPADHVIEPVQEFRRAVHAAHQICLDQPKSFLTFGIKPAYPAVGYGYIQKGPESAQRQGLTAFKVSAFKEKPSAAVAQEFFSSGEYYWNSGIFVWKASAVLESLAAHKPELHQRALAIAEAWPTPQREEVLQKEFPLMEKISVDYAIMEKAQDVLVLQTPYQWDDVGSWLALERLQAQDAEDNTVAARHLGIKTSGSIVVSDNPKKLIVTIGVKDLLIVQDGDALLVADKRDESALKKMVEMLKDKGLGEFL
ncbi:MAG: mannose-1-phosphate guanylyltransferase [Gemmataceae bacterium]|nr:mannose-1-phosphate guanylyltransferase [Gemmataceae bacterium]